MGICSSSTPNEIPTKTTTTHHQRSPSGRTVIHGLESSQQQNGECLSGSVSVSLTLSDAVHLVTRPAGDASKTLPPAELLTQQAATPAQTQVRSTAPTPSTAPPTAATQTAQTQPQSAQPQSQQQGHLVTKPATQADAARSLPAHLLAGQTSAPPASATAPVTATASVSVAGAASVPVSQPAEPAVTLMLLSWLTLLFCRLPQRKRKLPHSSQPPQQQLSLKLKRQHNLQCKHSSKAMC